MSERWVNELGDEVTMTRQPGGFTVKLTTSRDDITPADQKPAAHETIGDAAKRAAHLAVDVAEGDTWSRTELLDPQDRLIADGICAAEDHMDFCTAI